jgi:hypothetical protein
MSPISSTSAFSSGATEPMPALLTSMVMVRSSRSLVSTRARSYLSLRSAGRSGSLGIEGLGQEPAHFQRLLPRAEATRPATSRRDGPDVGSDGSGANPGGSDAWSPQELLEGAWLGAEKFVLTIRSSPVTSGHSRLAT